MRPLFTYAVVLSVGVIAPALAVRAARYAGSGGGAAAAPTDIESVVYERVMTCESPDPVLRITAGRGQPLDVAGRSFPLAPSEWAELARALPADPGRQAGSASGCCRDRLTVTRSGGARYVLEVESWSRGPADGIKRALWTALLSRKAPLGTELLLWSRGAGTGGAHAYFAARLATKPGRKSLEGKDAFTVLEDLLAAQRF